MFVSIKNSISFKIMKIYLDGGCSYNLESVDHETMIIYNIFSSQISFNLFFNH